MFEFPGWIIKLIMAFLTTTEFQILWNGQPSPTLYPSIGIRQGDPLSPYIFVLCMERLSRDIDKAVLEGNWKSIRVKDMKISRTFYADDVRLFGEARLNNLEGIMRVLNNVSNG